ncbi:hypothetical protein CCR95_02535 [Thiocystis minor]|uniref:ATP-binding protein n=1 Tax=Thiocystis minor TaxID=61597 RepID=UPI001912DB58|nr:ATP-binding protein [Thiocystis minor]MBK5962997.1 hypothetical protein [Thiocystis minor]
MDASARFLLLKQAVRLLIERMRQRPDSEHQQATIRLVLGGLICIYLLTLDFSGASATWSLAVAWVVGLFTAASILLFAAVVANPRISPVRRVLGIVTDMLATSAAMLFTGEGGTPLLAVYLWVIVGNGFRYGVKYLVIATAIGVAGFVCVIVVSDFWAQHGTISISLLIVLLVIPGYVAGLLNKLNDTMERLKEANDAKSRFLAKMSHELRTPLNGVIGMSDLLMDSGLDARQQGLARTIQTSAGTLLGIIENILDFSKIEAGRISVEELDFDLHQLTADTLQMFKPQARRKGLRLILLIDPRVPFQLRGDSLHLRQILMNLLSNAVKFTEQGEVNLQLKLVGVDQGWVRVRFEINDTGIGIPLAEQERIFESFRQADSSITRRFGGTGLGTAIARELTHLLGGQIGLKSEVGRGTQFWVELPLSTARETTADPAESLANTRLLVVGGKNAYAKLRPIFDGWRVESQSVPTCASAFAELLSEATQGRHYSGVLAVAGDIDLLPEQFAVGVRAEATLQETGLVLLDASPAHGSAQALRDAGFSAVLSAPLDKTLLFNAIHVARSAWDAPDNVVSLAEYYSQLSATPAQGLSILIAEDNETNRMVLQGILERAGHRVTVVADGETALDMLESPDRRFDLMILDKNMPGRSGLDVFRAYRFMVPRNAIPCIILSADATPEALTTSRDAGVDAYLTKPVETYRLLTTIAQLCRQAGRATAEIAPAKQVVGDSHPETGGLVDVAKLHILQNLGGDSRFFEELVAGFLRDSRRSLQKMAVALQDRDYPMLREAIHALRGSASELGATELVALCATLRALKPFELETPRAAEILAAMQHAYADTATLLTDFQRDGHQRTFE